MTSEAADRPASVSTTEQADAWIPEVRRGCRRSGRPEPHHGIQRIAERGGLPVEHSVFPDGTAVSGFPSRDLRHDFFVPEGEAEDAVSGTGLVDPEGDGRMRNESARFGPPLRRARV